MVQFRPTHVYNVNVFESREGQVFQYLAPEAASTADLY